MTGLVPFLILVFVAIAIWQMIRIFELTQSISGESSGVATEKDNNINGYIMLCFTIFVYLTIILSLWEWGGLLLPKSASEHGKEIDRLMNFSWMVIFPVQFIVQGLLHWFAFRYRGLKGRKALFYADNHKLEFIWTAIPVVVLAGLILYGLFTWTQVMSVGEDDDPLVIEVYARQFQWEARYGGNDNTPGRGNVRFVEGVNTMGVDPSDKNSYDDIPVSELHLPKGRKILFKFRSQDVLHSAYMPHFRAQMNCVPGMVTQFAFTPTVTTAEMRKDENIQKKVANINKIRAEKSKELVLKGEEALEPWEFDYLILCNKICGATHYNMQMKIIVEEEEEFNTWLKKQKTFAEIIGQ